MTTGWGGGGYGGSGWGDGFGPEAFNPEVGEPVAAVWAIGASKLYRLNPTSLEVRYGVSVPNLTLVDVVAAAGYLWVLAQSAGGASTVYQLDRGACLIRAIPLLTNGATRIAYDGTRYIYSSKGDRVDLTTYSAAVVAAGFSTFGIAVDLATGRVFASDGSSNLDWFAPPAKGLATVNVEPVAGGVENVVPVLAAAGAIWAGLDVVAGPSNAVVRVDPEALTQVLIAASTADSTTHNLTRLAYNALQGKVYAAYRDGGRVDSIDPATNAATLLNGALPPGTALASIATAGTALWYGEDATGTVSAVDLGTRAITATATIEPASGGIRGLAVLVP